MIRSRRGLVTGDGRDPIPQAIMARADEAERSLDIPQASRPNGEVPVAADPTVAVCICTKYRPDELERTLASIARSNYPVAQIVVSDDGHTPDTEAVCESAEMNVVYVPGPRRGLGANRNRALEEVATDVVLFLDDDCRLLPDFCHQALARMRPAEEVHGRRVIVSGREVNRAAGLLVDATDQTFLGWQTRRYGQNEPLNTIVINSTLFPSRLFERIRFDPQLIYGFEEVDLATRAVAAGYVIVDAPDAVNDHRCSPRSRESYERHFHASRLHVTFRRYASTERRPIRAVAFAVIAPAHLLGSNLKLFGRAGLGKTVSTLWLTMVMLWRGRAEAQAF